MALYSDPVPVSGPNDWFIDELRRQYQENPRSVPEVWRLKFEQEGSPPGTGAPAAAAASGHAAPATADRSIATNGGGARTSAPALPAAAPTPSPPPAPQHAPAAAQRPSDGGSAGAQRPSDGGSAGAQRPSDGAPGAGQEPGEALRGVAARIVANMEASLDVPTATSFREVPAKLLEVNRKVLNNHLRRNRSGKVSFTHIIGYAVVRAIADTVPNMNASFVTGADGKPRVVHPENVNLGIAVDQQKADGSRSLVVPVIKAAETLSFRSFVDTYEDLIRKVRDGKLTVDDMTGATVSLTNPGTIGTIQSVPRLMPGQGVIVGVGRMGYPAAFEAADPKVLAKLGVAKSMVVTSTYDHRIIQGAESGEFLKRVHELLLGEDGFYDQIFADMEVPYEAVQWREDRGVADADEVALFEKQMAVNTLINQYRVRGHLIAATNPLSDGARKMHPELDPLTFGLTIWDLDREFLTGISDGVYASVGGEAKMMRLGDILGILRNAYCRTVGVEYMHIANPEEKRWIQEQVEGRSINFSREDQHHILERLTAAEALEKFLATRYVGQKRFGIEGAESAIPILDALLSCAADNDMVDAVLGMAHRGRLNVLVNIMGKSYGELFREFEGIIDESSMQGSGDVKYHLGHDGVHKSPEGNTIAISLAANPSHLEAVDPVVVGMARAKMDRFRSEGRYPVLPVLIHGDAAFAGQGVVAETLNLSQVKGYIVGGTVHLIINNQLGYTTAPHHSRSSEYSTDIAKTVQAPIFHVNADDPEACVRVGQLAFAYRQRFRKDVVIDMIGYRRHGHNEGDDPSYTQPIMYRKIAERSSVRTLYTQALIDRGDISVDEAERAMDYFQQLLQKALDETREAAPAQPARAQPSRPARGVLPQVDTSVSREVLDEVYRVLSTTPEGFTVHPKLAKQFEARDQLWASGQADWGLGEAFALGSLLSEGRSIRFAGQDTRRGTFAHRHATLIDYQTGNEFTPLGQLARDGNNFWIYDSTLSEYAAMGFEYGYSVENKDALVLWEAQFGDFVNGAQIIIDQFLVAAEDKWGQTSGLVLLLPHGFEGQGPEHSSARIERFLILSAEDNIQVVNCTTAAQYFHLLRRQVVRDVRKPLVVFTPKSLLRAKVSRSGVEEFTQGTFQEVLDLNDGLDAPAVKRIVLANGKVATEAEAQRDATGAPVAVARIEQLYPWPFDAVAAVVERFPNAREIVWLQEEPENMGSWNFVKGRLYEAHGDSHTIRRVSRAESGSPATGSAGIHKQEQQELLERAVGNLPG